MVQKVILSGSKVKEARKALHPKLIQEDVAGKLGITRVTYIQWESREELELTLHDAEKLAKVLKVKLDDLLKKSSFEKVNTHVNTVNEGGAEYGKAFEKYDQIYKDLIVSKDKHLESKEEEIKRLLADKDRLWSLVNTLTEGFASLKKA
jgi:transcriptional regulator with XRE-family HTH domain